MDPISVIRQMMAESKFSDAQKLAEAHLSSPDGPLRSRLLPLYLESLERQDHRLPPEILIETIELTLEQDPESAIKWMGEISGPAFLKDFKRVQLLRIRAAEKKGRLNELHALISDLKMHHFRSRIPARIEAVDSMVQKYFKNDFHLKLHDLALALMLGDFTEAESQVVGLICSCVERASPRATREKLLAIAEIIGTQREKCQLEIYQQYCRMAAGGIKEKSGYKRLAEMIIYFDDFRFQVLVLDLLEKLGLGEAAADYALDIRLNKGYDFVYVEKYFGHLKGHFMRPERDPPEKVETPTSVDFTPGSVPVREEWDDFVPEPSGEEESLMAKTLKFQSFSFNELLELAVSFLQSNYPKAALEASTLAIGSAMSNREFLKASYLKLTCLHQLGDYRAVIDLAMDSLDRSESQDDILSFLYLQAEAYQKLRQNEEARRILKKILSIDSKYRLTRERLERLDEI